MKLALLPLLAFSAWSVASAEPIRLRPKNLWAGPSRTSSDAIDQRRENTPRRRGLAVGKQERMF